VQLAQKTINGDPNDVVNYPGYVAAGVIVHIATPTLRRISAVLSISMENGFDETDVAVEVQRVVANYIDNRQIGDDVILSKIIERAMSVRGVSNVIVSDPTSDVIILEDELPVSFNVSGTSLVTVL
jgi:phage-related baseplate assembly protein